MSHALASTSSRYGHVMFPSNVHLPAVQLADYLITQGPGKGWAHRVFYSDDGSTAMEIAIKMAFRLFEHRSANTAAEAGESSKQGILL
jgi:bifunctional dethiobiotin synthetase / adenosylmethionine---8-amino-7-oxononanoate aminotransferase